MQMNQPPNRASISSAHLEGYLERIECWRLPNNDQNISRFHFIVIIALSTFRNRCRGRRRRRRPRHRRYSNQRSYGFIASPRKQQRYEFKNKSISKNH